MEPRKDGTKERWNQGKMEQCMQGRMEPGKNETWNQGREEPRKMAAMEGWNQVNMEPKKNGIKKKMESRKNWNP